MSETNNGANNLESTCSGCQETSKETDTSTTEPDEISTSDEVQDTDNLDVDLLNYGDCILLKILQHLDAYDLFSLYFSCKRFNCLVNERRLWEIIDLRRQRMCARKFSFFYKRINNLTRTLMCVGINPLEKCITSKQLLNLGNLSKNLTVLSIEYQFINSNEVKMINFPGTLRELSLRGTVIEGGANFFRNSHIKHPGLHTIILDECDWVIEYLLMALSKYKSLENLSLYKCKNLNDSVAYMTLTSRLGFKSLLRLDVRLTKVGNQLLKCLNNLQKLREVYMEAPTVATLLEWKQEKRKMNIARQATINRQSNFCMSKFRSCDPVACSFRPMPPMSNAGEEDYQHHPLDVDLYHRRSVYLRSQDMDICCCTCCNAGSSRSVQDRAMDHCPCECHMRRPCPVCTVGPVIVVDPFRQQRQQQEQQQQQQQQGPQQQQQAQQEEEHDPLRDEYAQHLQNQLQLRPRHHRIPCTCSNKRRTQFQQQLLLQQLSRQQQLLQEQRQLWEARNQMLHEGRQQLQVKNEQLREEQQQLQVNNEQLREKRQQLQVKNEQLREERQQLQVNNEQLRVKKQQLQLNNQQLQLKKQLLHEKRQRNEQPYQSSNPKEKISCRVCYRENCLTLDGPSTSSVTSAPSTSASSPSTSGMVPTPSTSSAPSTSSSSLLPPEIAQHHHHQQQQQLKQPTRGETVELLYMSSSLSVHTSFGNMLVTIENDGLRCVGSSVVGGTTEDEQGHRTVLFRCPYSPVCSCNVQERHDMAERQFQEDLKKPGPSGLHKRKHSRKCCCKRQKRLRNNEDNSNEINRHNTNSHNSNNNNSSSSSNSNNNINNNSRNNDSESDDDDKDNSNANNAVVNNTNSSSSNTNNSANSSSSSSSRNSNSKSNNGTSSSSKDNNDGGGKNAKRKHGDTNDNSNKPSTSSSSSSKRSKHRRSHKRFCPMHPEYNDGESSSSNGGAGISGIGASRNGGSIVTIRANRYHNNNNNFNEDIADDDDDDDDEEAPGPEVIVLPRNDAFVRHVTINIHYNNNNNNNEAEPANQNRNNEAAAAAAEEEDEEEEDGEEMNADDEQQRHQQEQRQRQQQQQQHRGRNENNNNNNVGDDENQWYPPQRELHPPVEAHIMRVNQVPVHEIWGANNGPPNRPRTSNLRVFVARNFRTISDSALPYLRNLPLELLDLTGSSVTYAGLRQFLLTNPDCRIIHESLCHCEPINHVDY